MGDHTPLLMVDTPPPSASASAIATPEMIGLTIPLAPNTQPKMHPDAHPNTHPNAKSVFSHEKPLKVSGVTLHQVVFAHEPGFSEIFRFDETIFDKIFDQAEKRIMIFSMQQAPMMLTLHRDMTQEPKSIPLKIKQLVKNILIYFLNTHLTTPNVFRNKIIYGMYMVISIAIIEFFLTMYEFDIIIAKLHTHPPSDETMTPRHKHSHSVMTEEEEEEEEEKNYISKTLFSRAILKDVKHFIKGMVAMFEIVPANPVVSKEISDMMNVVIGKIVRRATKYGGKMSKRSIKQKRMKRMTVKHKRMKRRTVKHIKKVLVN
jgi:hypothetical protein